MKLLILFALVCLALTSEARQAVTKSKDASPTATKTADKLASLKSQLDEGSGDYDEDDYDDYDDQSSGDDTLEKVSDADNSEALLSNDDLASTLVTTTLAPQTTIKDDIHFVEEDDTEVQIGEKTGDKPSRRPTKVDKSKGKDDLLYEYYSEYFDEDYDDLAGSDDDDDTSDTKLGVNVNSIDDTLQTNKIVTPVQTSKTDEDADDSSDDDSSDDDDNSSDDEDEDSSDTEKSAIFPSSYIFLIIASALVSFTVFMLAFLICRRTVAQRRQKKLKPFIVSSTSYGPPSLPSAPIVKNYQRVPTSTKEFLYQQQQQMEQKGGETKAPLLT